MNIILASGSPRRKELLEMLGIKDLMIIPPKREEIFPENLSPSDTVGYLSLMKALEIAVSRGLREDDTIIGADTIVWYDNRIFGKPHDAAEAVEMLRTLRGHTHEVYTGVSVISGCTALSECEVSRVHFRDISDREIAAYVATGEPLDKAGSYGAQGRGALFVRGIDGDFFNVMGLPLCRLDAMLKKVGYELI